MYRNPQKQHIKEIGYDSVTINTRTYDVYGWWDKKRNMIAVKRRGKKGIFAMKKPIQYDGITDVRFHRSENY